MRQLLGHLEVVFEMRMLTGCFPRKLQTRFSHTAYGFTLSPSHAGT